MAILSILASVVLPYAELTVKRTKELALRQELRDLRQAIDQYKENLEKGVYGPRPLGESLYPKTLQVLIEKRLLRKVPLNPFTQLADWKTRSTTDPINGHQASDRKDVFDVFMDSQEKGLEGTAYHTW